MEKVYKPNEMIFVATVDKNYGDDPDNAAYYMHERNVYAELSIQPEYPD